MTIGKWNKTEKKNKQLGMPAHRAEVGAERSYPTNFRPLNTIQSSFCVTNNMFNRRPVHLFDHRLPPHHQWKRVFAFLRSESLKKWAAMRKRKWMKIILLIMCLIVEMRKKGGNDSLFMNHNWLRWMLGWLQLVIVMKNKKKYPKTIKKTHTFY